LRDNGVEPTIIEYLKDIPTGATLKNVAAKLGKHPNQFVRKGEADFKENNLQETLENERALIAAMTHFPKIIERPIVVKGDKAVIGRPPENVLDLL
tara:strand:- start:1210 stop:1497 length:288 start_codon:yes stop_codon:yes gene_type:complete